MAHVFFNQIQYSYICLNSPSLREPKWWRSTSTHSSSNFTI